MENMKKYLIVIDVQNDFVTGALGSDEAVAILPAVRKKIAEFKGNVIYTQDTHQADYLTTQEGKLLPVAHCIEGSDGWQIVSEIAETAGSNVKTYCKPGFGSKELANDLSAIHQASGIEEIELIGLCTDICVVTNALLLKSFLPEVPIVVDAQCCAGTTPDNHQKALGTMQCCQIKITNQH